MKKIFGTLALAVLLTSTVPAHSKGMSTHYYANPKPASEHWLNDPESPCFWDTTQKSLTLHVMEIITKFKFPNIKALAAWARLNGFAQPSISNARMYSFESPTKMTCLAGIMINGNIVEVPGGRNQLYYTVTMLDGVKTGVARLTDKNIKTHDINFWKSRNWSI